MASKIQWIDFDSPEAKGRIGIEVGTYGLYIYTDDNEHCIALVDLFCQSQVGFMMNSQSPHTQLIVYDHVNSGDELAIIQFLPRGARLILPDNVKEQEFIKDYGPSMGIDPEK